jgi:hypothetical protein
VPATFTEAADGSTTAFITIAAVYSEAGGGSGPSSKFFLLQ